MALFRTGHIDGFFYGYLALMLIVLWPGFCVNAKRWHDRNRPGYLAALVYVLVYASLGLAMLKGSTKLPELNIISIIFNIVYVIVSIWAFVECGCLDGTKGPNSYGPSPKNINKQADVF